MLKIDYTLKRQEGKEALGPFHPHETLKEIDGNAVKLSLKNGRGKSYLMNILALGMFGNRLSEGEAMVDESLRDNLEDLLYRDEDKLTFDYTITSSDGSTQLHAVKKDELSPSITLTQISGKKSIALDRKEFAKNYYLVYDFPKSTTKRVEALVQEIANQQGAYLNKSKTLLAEIDSISVAIGNSRDEKRIKDAKERYDKALKEKKELEDKYEDSINKRNVLEYYLALREYTRYRSRVVSLGDKAESLAKKKKQDASTVVKTSKKCNAAENNVDEDIDKISAAISELYSRAEVTPLFQKDDMRNHLDYLADYDFYSCKENCCFTDNAKISGKLDLLYREANKILKSSGLQNVGITNEFYTKLIGFLESYKTKSIDLSIPGFDITISDFIDKIKEGMLETRELSQEYQNIKLFLEQLALLKQLIENFPSKLTTLKVAREEKNKLSSCVEKTDAESNEMHKINSEIETAFAILAKYETIIRNNGGNPDEINNSNYMSILNGVKDKYKQYSYAYNLNEVSLGEEIKKAQSDATKIKEGDLESITFRVAEYKAKYESESSKKEHKYYSQKDKIEKIRMCIDSLNKKLSGYQSSLNSVRKADSESIKKTPEIEYYNNVVSRYLALLIKNIYYIDEYVVPEKIDLVSQKIITSNNREILMKNLSTGQSMSFYINSILKRPKDDSRKLILLMDETATMDATSFQVVADGLKQLQEEGRLMFALFVKVGESEKPVLDIIC